MDEEIKTCDMCGGKMVYIRGRYPDHDKRLVCPTCMADTLEHIRDRLDPSYGKAYQAK